MKPAIPWSGWTDEALARLQEMAAEGLSATQIGKALGCSRNSAIGKIYRLGLFWGNSAARIGGAGAAMARRTRMRNPPNAAPEFVPVPHPPRKPPGAKPGRLPKPMPETASANPQTILTIRYGQCRWALQDAREEATMDTLFCAAPVREPGCPYCATHAARASSSQQPSKRLGRLSAVA